MMDDDNGWIRCDNCGIMIGDAGYDWTLTPKAVSTWLDSEGDWIDCCRICKRTKTYRDIFQSGRMHEGSIE